MDNEIFKEFDKIPDKKKKKNTKPKVIKITEREEIKEELDNIDYFQKIVNENDKFRKIMIDAIKNLSKKEFVEKHFENSDHRTKSKYDILKLYEEKYGRIKIGDRIDKYFTNKTHYHALIDTMSSIIINNIIVEAINFCNSFCIVFKTNRFSSTIYKCNDKIKNAIDNDFCKYMIRDFVNIYLHNKYNGIKNINIWNNKEIDVKRQEVVYSILFKIKECIYEYLWENKYEYGPYNIIEFDNNTIEYLSNVFNHGNNFYLLNFDSAITYDIKNYIIGWADVFSTTIHSTLAKYSELYYEQEQVDEEFEKLNDKGDNYNG